jgi:hypothetical protein
MNQELIDRYVAGRLSEAEAEAFEEYCLANPEFAKQVEYEQRLKAGLAVVARGSTAEFVRSNNPHPLRWHVAAAAGILLSVGMLYYVWNHYLPHAVDPVMAAVTTDAQRNGASLRLALVRGNEAVPALNAGVTRVEIVGLFDLGVHYSVVLDRLDKNKKVDTVATLSSQHPTSPVTIEVMIDGDQLQPGTYTLRVRRQTSDEESLDFGFVKL